MKFIWVTRGRDWGFEFLEKAEISDPLSIYEGAFLGIENQPQVCRRIDGIVALRFPDPLGRQDAAGRVIPHEFVLFETSAHEIESVQEGLEKVWPLVENRFASVWEGVRPPLTSTETHGTR